MFALTVKQPHAHDILHSGKNVENRTWKLPDCHRNQWIALHAAKTADKTCSQIVEIPKDHYGAIIGFIRFADCVQDYDSRWAIAGQYHWIIDRAIAATKPMPCKGYLRFWRVSDELIQTVTLEIFLPMAVNNRLMPMRL